MPQWLVPSNIKQLRGFLVLAGHYRKFLKGFGAICRPPLDLLKKEGLFWSEGTTIAFETLKQVLVSALVPAIPNYTLPFFS